MRVIKEVVGGQLYGPNGEEVDLPIGAKAVPKPETIDGSVPKINGIVPNGTFTEGGFTLAELDQGSEVLREARSRGGEFIETATGTTDTVIMGAELPKRRNIRGFGRG